MKYFSVILIIFSLLLSSLAVADLSTDVTILSQQLSGTELTGVAGAMLKSEKVNVYIKDGENTQVFGLVTEKRKVISLAEGELEEPTLKVFSDLATITSIQNSATPADDLKKALDEGKITYEAVGFFKKVKFGFSNFFTKMFGGSKDDQKDMKEEVKEELKNETKEEKKIEQEQKKNETEQKVEEKKEEVKSEEKNETTSDNPENETETEVELEEENEVEVKGETHTILLQNNGFSPATLNIKAGDTVKWKISRSGTFKNGMIIGTQSCIDIKSKILSNGEEFEWQFNEAGTCTVVDGIITTQISKVIVE